MVTLVFKFKKAKTRSNERLLKESKASIYMSEEKDSEMDLLIR